MKFDPYMRSLPKKIRYPIGAVVIVVWLIGFIAIGRWMFASEPLVGWVIPFAVLCLIISGLGLIDLMFGVLKRFL